MGCGTSFVKYVLFFFNLLFALIGLAMVGIGVAVLLNWGLINEVLQKSNLTVAPWLFIVLGAVVFVIAFFGCCGAIRESHCMVVTYAIFLLVIIIVQVALAVLLFVYSESIREALHKSVDHMFQTAKTDKISRETFSNIEIQLECCGSNGPTDYLSLRFPDSCCTRGRGVIGTLVNSCEITSANTVGCAAKVGDLYQTWNKTIAGVAIGVACVEVVGALFALCLANSIRNMDRRYA
ncbi:hypothetical protein JYU34_007034 [Plutella xylostella]|uniref:Tetraspanin n=1 Tax=Plutella xylostella TaxID=51655 RepID=A0ABQ7QPG7_PLUXY|nr:CD63 antigen isoform X2 [Plutella xylostella]KAG7306925.1 hypothetical protein JYU34_007034 [Plutella xylostella]